MIQTIKDNIQQWNEIRNTLVGFNFLTSGYGVEIEMDDFNRWEAIRTAAGIALGDFNIHLYIGIDDLGIKFYLTDSHTDAAQSYVEGHNLITKSYARGDDAQTANNFPISANKLRPLKGSQVPIETAFESAFSWFLYSDNWFQQKQHEAQTAQDVDQAGVVRVFTVPFDDITDIFQTANVSKAFLFYGIKNYTDAQGAVLYPNEIEMLLCNIEDAQAYQSGQPVTTYIVQDLTTPSPPFSTIQQPFNLFQA
ncbi:hypothetical protein KFE98_08075 [bacterium SCSIO 12741]|nr:hypothetical protein KFE98_08075 [bacterium SCSIO 12741]